MFSLVITIISIALVAALALATLYYGGAAFNKGSADAEASKIMLQGQQLLGAAEMYYADKNEWPTKQQLLDGNYLKAIPTASAVASAMAAGVEWDTPAGSQALFLLSGSSVSADTCAAVNQKGSLGKRGILVAAYPSLNAQCFGEGPTYKVVFKKFGDLDSLDNAGLDLATEVVKGPVPSTNTGDEWSREPDAVVGGGGGGAGGDNPGDGSGEEPPATATTYISDDFTGAEDLLMNGHTTAQGYGWNYYQWDPTAPWYNGNTGLELDGSGGVRVNGFTSTSSIGAGVALFAIPTLDYFVEVTVNIPADTEAGASIGLLARIQVEPDPVDGQMDGGDFVDFRLWPTGNNPNSPGSPPIGYFGRMGNTYSNDDYFPGAPITGVHTLRMEVRSDNTAVMKLDGAVILTATIEDVHAIGGYTGFVIGAGGDYGHTSVSPITVNSFRVGSL